MDTGFCIASISGQSMGASAAWDGKIEVEEYVERFILGTGSQSGRMQVKAFAETMECEIKEIVSRFYSDVKAGRTALGGFAMPFVIDDGNS